MKITGCILLILLSRLSLAQVMTNQQFSKVLSELNRSKIIDSLVYQNEYSDGENIFIEKDSLLRAIVSIKDDERSISLNGRKAYVIPEVDLFHYGIKKNIKFIDIQIDKNAIQLHFRQMHLIFNPSKWKGLIKITKYPNDELKDVKIKIIQKS